MNIAGHHFMNSDDEGLYQGIMAIYRSAFYNPHLAAKVSLRARPGILVPLSIDRFLIKSLFKFCKAQEVMIKPSPHSCANVGQTTSLKGKKDYKIEKTGLISNLVNSIFV